MGTVVSFLWFAFGAALVVLVIWLFAWIVGAGYGAGFRRFGVRATREEPRGAGSAGGAVVPVGGSVSSQSVGAREDGHPEVGDGSAAAIRELRLSTFVSEIESAVGTTPASPFQLLAADMFLDAGIWAASAYSVEELLDLFGGDRALPAWIALEALRIHPEGRSCEGRIIERLGRFVPWTFFFGVRAIFAFHEMDDPIIGPLLCRVDRSWFEEPRMGIYGDLAVERMAKGEVPTFAGALAGMDKDGLARIEAALDDLPPLVADPLLEELKAHRDGWIDREFLGTIGRVWVEDDSDAHSAPLPHAPVLREVEQIAKLLGSDSPRSVLVVGEPGVGKRSLLRALGRRMMEEGWTVFEAGAAELNAGQVWVGALEGRIQSLVTQLRAGKRAVWFVPEFPGLLDAGKSQQNQSGALDALQGWFERGEVLVVGLAEPGGYDRLALAKPRLVSSFWVTRIAPLPPAETREIARAWSARRSLPDGRPIASDAVVEEACALAEQMRDDTASPGNVLLLLRETYERVQMEADRSLEIGDVIETLARRTGLPQAILDDRIDLDLEALHEFFAGRVMGQTEAVSCLVERITMIKAGLTDPTRPLAVFLFVGPTGTGKTEIAKALATWLFGSESRLLRLDMSEIQTAGDLSRIYGEPGRSGSALIDRIRQQPFAVVLLDEFEKAHPAASDLFLQVFDDGRLTDTQGRTASFRNAIVILTSNLGSELPVGDSLGFSDTRAVFSPSTIQRSVDGYFRREFINRLDRVIAFLPLGRDTMREILHRELDMAFDRRGLKQRRWAVEWDEGALEFLLTRGFTPDLGARPLRRAIERYLLEPLALTIVRHQVPHGDQFLFVRAKSDRLVVEFVDPDGPGPSGGAEGRMTTAGRPMVASRASTEDRPLVGDRLPADAGPTRMSPAPSAAAMGGEGAVSEGGVSVDGVSDGGASGSGVSEGGASGRGVSERGDSEGEERTSSLVLAPVRERLERLSAITKSESWQRARAAELEMTSVAGFWEAPDRFEVLGLFEYRDRVERALGSALSLLDRLCSTGRSEVPDGPAQALAQRTRLLEVAMEDVRENRSREAYLSVEAAGERTRRSAGVAQAGRRLVSMYQAWSDSRGMRMEPVPGIDAGTGAPEEFRAVFAVSGLGAHTLLAPEDGLHVFEEPAADPGPEFDRVAVRVRVVPRPSAPLPTGRGAASREALAMFGVDTSTPAVVRRYREKPSPLVRDAVRGWRTGRLDLVLAGEFDMLGPLEAAGPEVAE